MFETKDRDATFWTARNKEATDVMQWLRAIFDQTIARGLWESNPAERTLAAAWPKINGQGEKKHYAAIPYRDLSETL